MKRTIVLVLAITASTLLAGCATNRSELKVGQSPTAVAKTGTTAAPPAAVTVPSKGIVWIRSVVDERVFEEKPSDASHPSLGFGGAAAATDEIRARAVGRKRNTFGKALGDILLANGQTVVGVVREALAGAFQAAGYQVAPGDPGSGANALVADVHVKEFWAWMRPGFWALSLNTRITTDVKFQGADAPLPINTEATDSRQMATESAWLAVIDQALADYKAKATEAIRAR
ncbi:MAG: hypothetical protein JSR73_09365 [Proteobacteria bacterium]|nr:hypothetical protein [Pseudomonadota bacterium]